MLKLWLVPESLLVELPLLVPVAWITQSSTNEGVLLEAVADLPDCAHSIKL